VPHHVISPQEAIRLLDALDADHDYVRTLLGGTMPVDVVRYADGPQDPLDLFVFEKEPIPFQRTGGPCRFGAALLTRPEGVDFHNDWIGNDGPICIKVSEEPHFQAFRKHFVVETLKRSEDLRLARADFTPVDAGDVSVLRFARKDREGFFRTVPLPSAQRQFDMVNREWPGAEAFVALVERTPASIVYAGLRSDYRHGTVEIFGLGTWPDFRNRGLAKKLVSAAVRRSLDWAERFVYIVEESNEASRKVARALGFRKAGLRIDMIGKPKQES
jgi:RimJ/RimL family protein N-acetyltransferase